MTIRRGRCTACGQRHIPAPRTLVPALAKDLVPLFRSRYRPEGAASFCRRLDPSGGARAQAAGLGEPPALPDLGRPHIPSHFPRVRYIRTANGDNPAVLSLMFLEGKMGRHRRSSGASRLWLVVPPGCLAPAHAAAWCSPGGPHTRQASFPAPVRRFGAVIIEFKAAVCEWLDRHF